MTQYDLDGSKKYIRHVYDDSDHTVHAILIDAVAGTQTDLGVEMPLGAIRPATDKVILKTEVVTFTAASATLKSLLAGGVYQSGVKCLAIKAAAAWSFQIGAAASMGSVTLDAGVLYGDIGCKGDTDLRVIAGGNVAALVVQEG